MRGPPQQQQTVTMTRARFNCMQAGILLANFVGIVGVTLGIIALSVGVGDEVVTQRLTVSNITSPENQDLHIRANGGNIILWPASNGTIQYPNGTLDPQ